MIQEVTRGMIMLMLAKFVLNDVPHAAGLLNALPGWSELVSFSTNRGLDLGGAIGEDIREGVVTTGAVQDYKTVMGGYYLIATGTASNGVVDSVYNIIKRNVKRDVSATYDLYPLGGYSIYEAVRILRREMGIPEDRPITQMPTEAGYLYALERVLWLDSFLKDGTRVDKAVAIDAAMHMVHDEGSYIIVVLGQGIRDGAIERMTPYVLEELFRG